eukprot:38216-Prorocentrum_minimum.AAC.3
MRGSSSDRGVQTGCSLPRATGNPVGPAIGGLSTAVLRWLQRRRSELQTMLSKNTKTLRSDPPPTAANSPLAAVVPPPAAANSPLAAVVPPPAAANSPLAAAVPPPPAANSPLTATRTPSPPPRAIRTWPLAGCGRSGSPRRASPPPASPARTAAPRRTFSISTRPRRRRPSPPSAAERRRTTRSRSSPCGWRCASSPAPVPSRQPPSSSRPDTALRGTAPRYPGCTRGPRRRRAAPGTPGRPPSLPAPTAAPAAQSSPALRPSPPCRPPRDTPCRTGERPPPPPYRPPPGGRPLPLPLLPPPPLYDGPLSSPLSPLWDYISG